MARAKKLRCIPIRTDGINDKLACHVMELESECAFKAALTRIGISKRHQMFYNRNGVGHINDMRCNLLR